MELITVKNLSFSYEREVLVLREVNLEVKKKEIVTVLGPNGSGKTTLLKCINAVLKPKTGCVYVNGTEVLKFKRKDLAKLMGIVPQIHKPSFPYTVLDVVLMGRTPYLGTFSQPSREDVRIAMQALNSVGISNLADRPYTQISGGEMQLVLIARALAQRPKILLLDEPIAHLDFRNKIRVLNVVKELTQKYSLAVIMSLHDPNYALIFSDKVALLSKGRIVACGKPKEVITRENLKAVYNLDVEVISYDSLSFVMPRLKV